MLEKEQAFFCPNLSDVIAGILLPRGRRAKMRRLLRRILGVPSGPRYQDP